MCDPADGGRGGSARRHGDLGHSQIGITMDVYTHAVQDTKREAISHMDRLLKRRVDRG